jgi:hypothetical protein
MIWLGDDGFRELGLARGQPIKSTRTGDFIFFQLMSSNPIVYKKNKWQRVLYKCLEFGH